MPTIEVSNALFARLQKLAVPLVDTPVTVIERLLSSYEARTEPSGMERAGTERAGAVPNQPGESRSPHPAFEPRTPPSLRHTRVLAAEFSGRKADGWNSLVHAAHIEAVQRLGSVEAVRRITTSKVILGRPTSQHEKRGYRYVSEINACIQNTDAEHAWSNTFRLAKALKVPVEIEFEWLNKNEAEHPGKTGRMSWKPRAENSPKT